MKQRLRRQKEVPQHSQEKKTTVLYWHGHLVLEGNKGAVSDPHEPCHGHSGEHAVLVEEIAAANRKGERGVLSGMNSKLVGATSYLGRTARAPPTGSSTLKAGS